MFLMKKDDKMIDKKMALLEELMQDLPGLAEGDVSKIEIEIQKDGKEAGEMEDKEAVDKEIPEGLFAKLADERDDGEDEGKQFGHKRSPEMREMLKQAKLKMQGMV